MTGGAEPTVDRLRLAAQLLSGPPARTPQDVVERLLAVQAQELRGARLAVRSRSTGLHVSDVDRALADRSLVVSWLCRGTLHLVRASDLHWLHALVTPGLQSTSARRLAQEGVPPDDADRGVEAVRRALAAHGPLPRAQLREQVAAAGVRVAGQALVHVLLQAELRGICVRGPVVDGEQAHVLRDDWLGPPPPHLDRDAALARLAARYLSGHGPATDRDLARWSGLPLRDARRGLSGAGARQRGDGLAELPGGTDAPLPPPRLLGPFDPLLLGWTSRQPVVGDADAGVVTSNGVFRPVALVQGRAVATWGLAAGRVTVRPFTDVAPADLAALHADADAVLRFLAPRPPERGALRHTAADLEDGSTA